MLGQMLGSWMWGWQWFFGRNDSENLNIASARIPDRGEGQKKGDFPSKQKGRIRWREPDPLFENRLAGS